MWRFDLAIGAVDLLGSRTGGTSPQIFRARRMCPCRTTTTTTILEDMDQKDWITAETEAVMLTEQQKMKSHAFAKREKMQSERSEIPERLNELEQRERYTAAVLGDLSDTTLGVSKDSNVIRPGRETKVFVSLRTGSHHCIGLSQSSRVAPRFSCARGALSYQCVRHKMLNFHT